MLTANCADAPVRRPEVLALPLADLRRCSTFVLPFHACSAHPSTSHSTDQNLLVLLASILRRSRLLVVVSPSWPPRMFATCWICPQRGNNNKPDLIKSRKSQRRDQVCTGDCKKHRGWLSLMVAVSEGITRELYALLGERAPPIAINENRYKGRPKWMSKLRVRPWCVDSRLDVSPL